VLNKIKSRKSAIILAGGMGTRLRSAIPNIPKPMAPIGGKPFLTLLLDYWISQGIDHFLISVGYLHEQIINIIGSEYKGIEINYSIESEPLGTGGALIKSLSNFYESKSVVILNGDSLFKIRLELLELLTRNNAVDGAIALFESSDSNRYSGVLRDANKKILKFGVNGTEITGPIKVNGGVYLFKKSLTQEILAANKNFFSLEQEIFPFLINANKDILGLEFKDLFIDIGVPEDYQRAQHILT
jgi:D-glycero-alpha-D-manno-heptose 1-phosphate guanylyltransferase